MLIKKTKLLQGGLMKQKIRNAIQAAFVADALSLGVHWEYDVARIKEKFVRIEHMTDPGKSAPVGTL